MLAIRASQMFDGVGVCSDERYQLHAEAKCVLDGMEALEHGKIGISARGTEVLFDVRQLAQAAFCAEKYASPPSRSVDAPSRPASVKEHSRSRSASPGPNTAPICMSRTNVSRRTPPPFTTLVPRSSPHGFSILAISGTAAAGSGKQ